MGRSKYIVHKVNINDADLLSELFTEFVGQKSDVNLIKNQIEAVSTNPAFM